MTVKLLTEHQFEFLSLKGDCTGSSEWTLVKMPHCWKSHVAAHLVFLYICTLQLDYRPMKSTLCSADACIYSLPGALKKRFITSVLASKPESFLVSVAEQPYINQRNFSSQSNSVS